MNADGFLVVDKPPGVTSHDVVALVRAVTGLKKVGHTGTLDPFATGVLPLALGGATRLIQYLDENEKVYDATVRLGVLMDTGDPTGNIIGEAPVPPVSKKDVLAVLTTFVGERMQTPPKYSAVKIAGRALYEYARKGIEVEAKPRPVTIRGMELVEFDLPIIRVMIRCSRGTYARVLAEEIGVALGTVGHLSALRRIGSGPFHIDHSVSFSRIAEVVAGDPAWDRVLRPSRGEERVPWRDREAVMTGLSPWVVSPREALKHHPTLSLSTAEARRFTTAGVVPPHPSVKNGPFVMMLGDEVLGVAVAGAQSAVPLSRETTPPPGERRKVRPS